MVVTVTVFTGTPPANGTPRYVPADGVDILEVQERVINDILRSAQEQQAIEAAPKQIDPIQQTVITALRGNLRGAGVDRRQVIRPRTRKPAVMPSHRQPHCIDDHHLPFSIFSCQCHTPVVHGVTFSLNS